MLERGGFLRIKQRLYSQNTLEISLSISIRAGEKGLTFFSCVPHLDSELPVYPAVCSRLPAPQGPPGSGRHMFLLLAVVLNLAHNLESPGEGGSAPPQSSIDTPEKLSQNLQAGWSTEGRCWHLMAAADSRRQPGSDSAPGETASIWSMRDLP